MYEGGTDILTIQLPKTDGNTGVLDNIPSPTFTTYDSFIAFFDQNNISLRNQLRYIVKYRSRLKDSNDVLQVLSLYRDNVETLIKEVELMGPIQGEEAVAGIDYQYYEGCPSYKNNDIIVKSERVIERETQKVEIPTEFSTFMCARILDEELQEKMRAHLKDMACAGYFREENIPKWLYFLGFEQTYNNGNPITEKLCFLGNRRALMYWMRSLYGLMQTTVSGSTSIPAGTYILPAVIKTLTGAGIVQSVKNNCPTTRDSYARVIASSVTLANGRALNPDTLTSTTDPSFDDMVKIIKLLEPLGCKRKD